MNLFPLGPLPPPTLAAQAEERAALVAQVGLAPEEPTAEGRYAATTGELARWAREDTAARESPAPKAPEPQEPTPRRQEEPLPQLAPGVVACGCGRAARWSYLPSRAACPDHGGQAVCLDPEHKPRDLCLECWCAIPAADRRMGWYLEYYPRPGEMEALETARERRRAVLELVELDEERAL